MNDRYLRWWTPYLSREHWLDDRKWCGHDWNYWRDMLPYYLGTICD